MPSLISSRQMAGQPMAAASEWASIVLPEPGGPLTTMRVGCGMVQSWHLRRNVDRSPGPGASDGLASSPPARWLVARRLAPGFLALPLGLARRAAVALAEAARRAERPVRAALKTY